MQSHYQPIKSGFTLMETLVAVTILLIGVLGPLTIAARGIADGLYAKNQLTANFLAQEAMEIIINQRDTNLRYIDSNSNPNGDWDEWDRYVDDCYSTNYCGVEPEADGLTTAAVEGRTSAEEIIFCSGEAGYRKPASCPPGSQPTSPVFTREITITPLDHATIPGLGVPPDGLDAMKVAVKIKWFNRAVPKEFTLVGYLYRCLATSECRAL